MATLVLIRGLPGSGAKSLATGLAENYRSEHGSFWREHWISDDYQHRSGLAGSDIWLKRAFGILRGAGVLIVWGDIAQKHEVEGYRAVAAVVGAKFECVDLFDGGFTDAELAARHKDGACEVATIAAMRARWEK